MLRQNFSAWSQRTPSNIATAISYFNKAIDTDSGYALAYSGLADAYSILPSYGEASGENYSKSNIAARRALELDPTLARPHAVLGSNEVEYEWDFRGGEAEYRKAFLLDPNDAIVHLWHAEQIGSIGGRYQEALAELNDAHQLEPLSPVISTAIGDVHLSAGEYDEAIAVCSKVATENPTFARAHYILAETYWAKHVYSQAIQEWKVYAQLSGDQNEFDFASAMEQGFRSGSWKDALFRGIKIRQAERKRGYSSAFGIAELYADLGDKDEAFRWLQAAYQERDVGLIALKTNFLLDPIRSDARFADLVRKVGLPR